MTLLPICDHVSTEVQFLEVSHRAMATRFTLLLYGEERGRLGYAADRAVEEIEWLEQQLSVYRVTSEVSGINARAVEEEVVVEPGLFGLLETSRRIWEETSGAFDITVGPLIRTWGFFRGRGELPREDSIASVVSRVGMVHVLLDGERRTIRFDTRGVQINLGGIGKGYAVDCIVEILKREGLSSAFVSAGGSTCYALGAPPGCAGWRVGIRHPFDKSTHVEIFSLRDRSLSTSGNYERFFEAEGRVYCDLLDPRTGRPVEGVLSATALSRTATETDALSTAFFVLGREGTERYCGSHRGVCCLLLTGDASTGCQVHRIGFQGDWENVERMVNRYGRETEIR